MNDIGFTECLRPSPNEGIIPTFKHLRGEIAHQLDHLYVTDSLFRKLTACKVEDHSVVFDNNLSDHLPIIADFDF